MRPTLVRIPLAVALASAAVVLSPPARAQKPTEPKLVAESEARTPAEERAGFHLPPGFVIELVASEPEIHKPMNLAFDDRGRLWVTSTVEYPYPAAPGTKPRDQVLILDEIGPDGRARKVTPFADGLNIPIGVLPLGRGDAALVHSIPDVLRLTDTDGDGRADRSEVAYEKYGFRDTHGMTNAFTWGFDGWIYACHGFNNDSQVAGSDKAPITMQSGNVYRMRPDGSHVEYYSHGQVNPFGLAFDPMGHLYSCDCHSRPIYQLLRGGYYPSFGKPDDGLGFGPTMIDHDHGSTGIGGISYYAADQFPPAYRDTVFIGNVVTSRINHDRLDHTGSSPKAVEQPDFVVSDDPWFRPVDIELGPDGALYIADFYNRIIGHYEVPLTHPGRDRERGRIWRIRYAGEDGKLPSPAMPRKDWSKASVAELVSDLGHPNLVVRTKATNQLVERAGADVIAAARASVTGGSTWPTVHALWVLHRLGALDESARALAGRSKDDAVRVHAHLIAADRPELDEVAVAAVLAGLGDPSPEVRRAASEAIGRHPHPRAVKPLLALVVGTAPADTHLIHTARIAVRDQFSGRKTSWADAARLDLTEREAAGLLDIALADPTPESAGYVLGALSKSPRVADRKWAARYLRHVARFGDVGDPRRAARFGGDWDLDTSLAQFIQDQDGDVIKDLPLFRAIQQGAQERGATVGPQVSSVATRWAQGGLSSGNTEAVRAAIELVGLLKLTKHRDPLMVIAENRAGDQAIRIAAMGTLAGLDPAGTMATLVRCLRDPAEAMPVRDQAAALLAAGNRPEGRAALVESLGTSPSHLQDGIATGLSGSRPGLEALLDAVAAGKVSARPLQIPAIAQKLNASGIPEVKARVAALLKDLPAADEKIQAVIQARREAFAARGGDVARGESVFRKNCAACHQMAGKGARIGPQLDGVGVRGPDRLLEDVMDPNRNVDQAFRVTNLALNDGRVTSGLLLRQDGQVFVLADSQGQEVRIPEASVEGRTTAQLSPMPANLGEQIPEPDFLDLLAYLLAQRPADKP